ncbi:chemotaxis protein CheA [Halarsenatibacter silvermanii]|uniref:Chemotaxis protein CheA n=1 Tax=Halarsenatibacter silvermanii TaxID=321763 RepID=A0A1G9SDZ7_9FIRM|nr:chemotaxis protein CheA [Halarsenatibacter silvermanii]SDM33716.1 two-component system, chemotaxis family, sensor kinase CheA [Halarsenatibacter silvermanii]
MDEEYLKMFFDEAEEYIQSLNEDILTLEQEPDNEEVINSIFRAAHSLKGMAATMGFDSLTNLTHKMENALDLIRNDELYLDTDLIDALFDGIDLINELVEDIKRSGEEETNVDDYVEKLNEMIESHRGAPVSGDKTLAGSSSGKELPEKGAEELEISLDKDDRKEIFEHSSSGDEILQIEVKFDEDSMLRSVRAYMVLKKAEELGYLVKSEPDRMAIEDDDVEIEDKLYLLIISSLGREEIKEEILDIIEIVEANITALDINFDEFTEDEKNKTSDSSGGSSDSKIEVSPTVRVDIDKLDKLMNMVGELLINKTQMEDLNIDNDVYKDIIQQLDRVTMELHHVVMQIRMVPIGGIFNRFPRLVRDLSRDLDKEVDLNIEGADTELDRSIIDELADPLVHIIRNAVDHGIEKPDVREEKGKPRTGQIDLSAYQKGSEIVIEIEDDGRGLDPDEIAGQAVEKGLVSSEEVETLSEMEKLDFIFSPGFSTSDEASEVSGRGVGMDVVKRVVESLDGQVSLESEPDQGTLITISLPLTLAITQALMVKIDRETFAIPLDAISETLTIDPAEIKTVRGQDVIVPRDTTIPVTEAARQLNINIDFDRYKEWEEIPVVTVNTGNRVVGLIIDEFLNQQEIVVKSLGEYLGNVENISGATIIGDGDVALILDVRDIA